MLVEGIYIFILLICNYHSHKLYQTSGIIYYHCIVLIKKLVFKFLMDLFVILYQLFTQTLAYACLLISNHYLPRPQSTN